MNQQIRNNVFETNSSSSHSLTMVQGDIVPTPLPHSTLRAGVLVLHKGEYGWEWYRYYDTQAKAAYLFTQLFHDDIPDGDIVTVTAQLREDDARFDMLCRVIEAYTGVIVQAAPGSSGYVDHESTGNGLEVFESDETLRQFLFSSESYIETGNDNSGPSPTIDTDRGPEHYYGAFYREPKPGMAVVELTAAELWRVALKTAGGAIVDGSTNPEVFDALKAEATVVAAHWECRAPWNRFEYSEPVSTVMSDLSEVGLFFSSALRVTTKYTHVSFEDKTTPRSEKLTFTVHMPETLAKTLAGLPATPQQEDGDD